MIKIIVPESGIIELGQLRSLVQGKADDEPIAFQGGRYVDPPVIEGAEVPEDETPAGSDAAAPEGAPAPKAKRGKK